MALYREIDCSVMFLKIGGFMSEEKKSGLEPNIAAMIAYFFGWIGGLVFLLIEKENKFVRFAAMQSIIMNVAFTVIYIALSILIAVIPGIGILSIVLSVFGLAYFVLVILLMVKAYKMEEWELPIVGQQARNFLK
jgi:uncharacterized membrane protein